MAPPDAQQGVRLRSLISCFFSDCFGLLIKFDSAMRVSKTLISFSQTVERKGFVSTGTEFRTDLKLLLMKNNRFGTLPQCVVLLAQTAENYRLINSIFYLSMYFQCLLVIVNCLMGITSK